MMWLLEMLLGVSDDKPLTFKDKLGAALREAAAFVIFSTIVMFCVVLTTIVGIFLLGTMKYWPPLLSFIALLGFLKGYGVLRLRAKK